MVIHHYELAMKAVDEKSKPDAQAAFYLLPDDAMHMRTDTLDLQAARQSCIA